MKTAGDRNERPGLPILMYHALPTGPTPEDGDAVPLATFVEQMQALADDGWRITGLTEARRLRQADAAAKVVAITFDDGYADLPGGIEALLTLGGSCTAYVITDYIADEAQTRFLDWNAVRALTERGIEIGSHSCSHPQLDIVKPAVAMRELRDSRERIEDALQTRVESFSYPNGYCSPRLRRLVQQAGYASACRIGRQVADLDDVFGLMRVQPRAETSGSALLHMVRHGEPGLAPRAKELASPAWRVARRAAVRVQGRGA